MIFTVFAAASGPAGDWRAQLLEYSWRRLEQPGELVRLAPPLPGEEPPTHRAARVVPTLAWNPHPYTSDSYSGYETPAAVLEWLFREQVDGTVVLLAPHSVLQHPIRDETTPGKARAMAWDEMPSGDGPFGLDGSLRFLECYCVNRTLPLPRVRMPLVIHTSDLRKLAARWLELVAIIRSEYQGAHGRLGDADRVAYAIAAAEYRVEHEIVALESGTEDTRQAPVIDYSKPVESPRGEIVWDEQVYDPWSDVFPEKARPGNGREFLALLNELVTRLHSGADMDVTRAARRHGVREARILDDLHIEVPGSTEPIALNQSAAAIWELCDGKRTLSEIVGELASRYDAPRETLMAAVEATTKELQSAGALELEDLL